MSEKEKAKAAEIAEKFQNLDYSEQRYVEGYMQGVQSRVDASVNLKSQQTAERGE